MAYAFVQAVQNVANANTVAIVATAGNLLVLHSKTSSGAGTPTITGIVTNNSAAFAQRIATFQNANGDWHSLFDLKNCPSGVVSLTVTYNGGTPGSCFLLVEEYSGLDTTAPYINSQANYQAAPGLTANAITSGANVNVTTVPALIIGVVANDNSNGDTVAGTGYTQRLANNDWCVMDKRITSGGNQQVTATAASHGDTVNYETVLAAYAEAGAGGGDNLLGQACL